MTIYSWRTIPTTSYSWRDPVGIVYLTDDFWNILTDDLGQWLYISQTNTQYTTDRTYIGQTWDDLWSMTWDDLWSMTWDDLFTWIAPTIYTSRPTI